MTADKRRMAEARGRLAECFAAWALRLRGYQLLERRFATPVGEIDLIARRGAVLAFVEVKRRSTLTAAFESVTPRQRQRILRAAGWYVARRPAFAELDWRFDIVCVAPGALPRHIAGAWTG